MSAPPGRVRAAASESHRKHRAWWDSVCRVLLSEKSLDTEEAAECQMRIKFAYEDYARVRWEEDLLLSNQWIDQVSPEEFLDWCRWQTHLHAKWVQQVEDHVASPEFQRKFELAVEQTEQSARDEFDWKLV